jgi:hypothetical protein
MKDVLDILALLARFGAYADARDWSAALQLFAPRLQVDYRSLFGGDLQSVTREELMATWQRLLPGFTHTQHTLGLPVVDVDGVQARASAPFIAEHVIVDPKPELAGRWTVGGRYEWRLSKADGDTWRIYDLALTRGWQDGRLDLPRIAAARVGSRETS